MKKEILFFILTLFSIHVFAKDAEVYYKKGHVQFFDINGDEKKVTKGDYLIEGDTVKTSEDSFVILKIKNHSTHRIEENSKIEIAKLPYFYTDSSELEQEGSFLLEVGTLFSEVFKHSDDESFRVQTKHTTMGVRGTKLMVSIDLGDEYTWLSVKEGIVEVSNELSGHKDLVEKNKSLVIEKDKSFTGQKSYDWQKNLKWNIVKNKRDFKSFRKQKRLALQEFKQRRTKWVRNDKRWQKYKQKRKERLERFRQKRQKLKSNPKLKQRKERLKKLRQKKIKKVNEFKQKKDFYKKRMMDKKSKYQSNQFLRKKKSQKKLNNRLDEMKQRRRRLRRKTP